MLRKATTPMPQASTQAAVSVKSTGWKSPPGISRPSPASVPAPSPSPAAPSATTSGAGGAGSSAGAGAGLPLLPAAAPSASASSALIGVHCQPSPPRTSETCGTRSVTVSRSGSTGLAWRT